jgi:hypothetical protein
LKSGSAIDGTSLGDFVENGNALFQTEVQRIYGIDGTVCQTVLDILVDEKSLQLLNRDGTYGRATNEWHVLPVKVSLDHSIQTGA